MVRLTGPFCAVLLSLTAAAPVAATAPAATAVPAAAFALSSAGAEAFLKGDLDSAGLALASAAGLSRREFLLTVEAAFAVPAVAAFFLSSESASAVLGSTRLNGEYS